MGLTEGHWFEDEEQLTERQLESAIADESEAYKRGLRDGRNKSNWHNVGVMLPDSSDTVLIAHGDSISFGWFTGLYWIGCVGAEQKEINNVTHWMPLPEPPKEGV